MKRWIYRVEFISDAQIANQLNFIGEEGWELVQVIPMKEGDYPYLCFFKRPA
jgi:hypothetical protein